MPVQSPSPSGEASPWGTSCEVPGNVRRVPAKWVRPRGPRLAMLASRTGKHTYQLSVIQLMVDKR